MGDIIQFPTNRIKKPEKQLRAENEKRIEDNNRLLMVDGIVESCLAGMTHYLYECGFKFKDDAGYEAYNIACTLLKAVVYREEDLEHSHTPVIMKLREAMQHKNFIISGVKDEDEEKE